MPIFFYVPIFAVLGLELIVAGVAKLVWTEGFREELTQAKVLPTWLGAPLAPVLPLVEVAIGIALLSLAPLRLLAGTGAALYGIFTLQHVILAIRRSSAPCGCVVSQAQTHKAAAIITGGKCVLLAAAVVYPGARQLGFLAHIALACLAAVGASALWTRGRQVNRTVRARLVNGPLPPRLS